MRRLVTAFLAMGVLTATAALTPVGAAVLDLAAPRPAPSSAQEVLGPVVLPAPPIPGEPLPPRVEIPAPSGPTLTDAQRSAAVETIASDPVVQRVLGGIDYSVRTAVPWVAPGSAVREVVGANVEIALASPLSGAVALPGIRFDSTNTTYERLVIRAIVDGTSRLSIHVDFREDGVVSISPADGAPMTELPGNKHFKPRGE
jgi:hypothetical protein